MELSVNAKNIGAIVLEKGYKGLSLRICFYIPKSLRHQDFWPAISGEAS